MSRVFGLSRKSRRPSELKAALDQLDQQANPTDIYSWLLRRCGEAKALSEGERIHAHIVSSRHAGNAYLGDLLVQMYGKCGSVENAKAVFDGLPRRNRFSWNIMIGAYTRNGHCREALELYHRMDLEPDGYTFASILGACSNLGAPEGKAIHRRVLLNGLHSNVVVATALVDMYAKFGELDVARDVFEAIAQKNVVTWNAMITGYAQTGHSKDAIQLYERMRAEGVKPDGVTFASILSACSNVGALETGIKIQAEIVSSLFQADIVMETALINMYANCGRLDIARSVFDQTHQKNVVTWNTMISAYAQQGHIRDAVVLFQKMDVEPDNVTFVSLLSACITPARLEEGKKIHARFLRSGSRSVSISTALVSMYAKGGDLKTARTVFDEIKSKTVVSWNAMITGYTQQGQGQEAIDLYEKMKSEGVQPDAITLSSVLGSCSILGALDKGIEVHEVCIASSQFHSDVVVQAALVHMYSRCGKMELARRLFDDVQQKSVVCWNAMTTAYVQQGHARDALDLYEKMDSEGVIANSTTFASVIGACGSIGALEEGKVIHGHVIERNMLDVFVETALIHMYARCGRLDIARRVFDGMENRDVVSWNAMVSAYAQNGHGRVAIDLYSKMDSEGMQPDCVTFASVLGACSSVGDLDQGKAIHALIITTGFHATVDVYNALVSMYANCGNLDSAGKVFERIEHKDVVSWNAMITAYAQHGHAQEALDLYDRMKAEGVQPDCITFAAVLGACSSIGALERGMAINAFINTAGFESNAMVNSALVSMYANCGRLDAARSVFDGCEGKDVVSWNSMISGYAQHGHSWNALDLFWKMDLEGVLPDSITYASVLGACSSVGALREGMKIHSRVTATGLQSDMVETALLNMYARCGKLDIARRLFEKNVFSTNLVAWTCMISAYAQHGHGKEALDMYGRMTSEGVQPDSITFVSILIACSHAGLLNEGWFCFMSMRADHEIAPVLEHYVCMIDLLGRSGQLHEAEDLVNSMPLEPDIVAWTSMLGACRVQGDMERGRGASSQIFELNPQKAAPYVLLSNIYEH